MNSPPMNPDSNDDPTVSPMPDVPDTQTVGPELQAFDEPNAMELHAGREIGPYKLLQKIGEGGMGTVYVAEQTQPVRRRVALKLIRTGMGSQEIVSRFEAERQALALMDHENIARVLDADKTSDGRLYFVMELIKGVSITEYCDKNRLSLNDRLNLFMQTCRAIQHAHQKGIIHRDIKPSNVLVTDTSGKAQVKVIDFGLAKALQAANRLTDRTMITGFGQVVGTLQYMSPEQAEFNALDVDTRSDVYSLGILLYELLTGTTPIERQTMKEMAFDRVINAIREGEAPRPSHRLSSLGRSATDISHLRQTNVRRLSEILKRDLDWITMKALEKDRTRRYDSPVQMAEDVQRYLNNEPVIARPPSHYYRVKKTLRKHRVFLGSLTVIVLLLFAGIVGTTSQLLRARTAEFAQSQQANKARSAQAIAVKEAEAAKKARDAAEISRKETESTLARSNYHLAVARWNENRAGDAMKLLARVPVEHRHFEWGLARREFEGSEVTLYGHTGSVRSVSFSPDGTRLASVSDDDTLKLWDATTGEELSTLKRSFGTRFVTATALSPDCTRTASGLAVYDSNNQKYENIIELRDVRGIEESKTLAGHSKRIRCVSFSLDGTQLASGSEDHSIKLWNASTGEELSTFRGHFDHVNTIAFSADGTQLASGSVDRTIKLWNTATGEILRTLTGDSVGITSVSFSMDGLRLASGSYDGTIVLWDVANGEIVNTFTGHSNRVSWVSFSPDGSRLASGSDDNTIRLWDATTGEEIRTFRGHAGPVSSVTFSLDGTRLASGSDDSTIKLWDATTGEQVRMLTGSNNAANIYHHVSFSPDGTLLASGGGDGTITLWDTTTGEEQRKLTATYWVSSVGLSENSTLLASGGYEGTIELWDIATGKILKTLKGHRNSVISVTFSPDGTQLASGSYDSAIKLWNALTGEEIRTFKGHAGSVESVSFSPDGTRLASGGDDSTVKLWDTSTGEELTTLEGHTGSVINVSFSPDGTRLVSEGDDNSIKLWDVDFGEELRSLTGHTDYYDCVSFRPDGMGLISASEEGTIIRWDAVAGRELTLLTEHLESVTFSPNGRQFASGSADGTIELWDLVTGEKLKTLIGHSQPIDNFCFGSDGMVLRSEDVEGTSYFWNVNEGQQISAEQASLSLPHTMEPQLHNSPQETFEQWDLIFRRFQQPGTSDRSSDGRWLVVQFGNVTGIVDLHFKSSPHELRRRRQFASIKSRWHREKAEAAELSNDWYAAVFHRAWLLKIQPNDAWAWDSLQETLNASRTNHKSKLPNWSPIVADVLKFERGRDFPQLTEDVAERLNDETWNLVVAPENLENATFRSILPQRLQHMRDVCRKYPRRIYFNTLGIAEYRAGHFESAIASLSQSLEENSIKFELQDPAPVVLAFLAMCHHKLGHAEEAAQFREKLNTVLSETRYTFDNRVQGILQEVDRLFDGEEGSSASVATIPDFIREGTFENLRQHRWRVNSANSMSSKVSLADDIHQSGNASLRITINDQVDDVRVMETVEVSPRSRYRMSGWIKTENVNTAPASENIGACLSIEDQDDCSHSLTGTTDWKHVTWEFVTGDTSVITIGGRLRHDPSHSAGTAWFDDLILEKLEIDQP